MSERHLNWRDRLAEFCLSSPAHKQARLERAHLAIAGMKPWQLRLKWIQQWGAIAFVIAMVSTLVYQFIFPYNSDILIGILFAGLLQTLAGFIAQHPFGEFGYLRHIKPHLLILVRSSWILCHLIIVGFVLIYSSGVFSQVTALGEYIPPNDISLTMGWIALLIGGGCSYIYIRSIDYGVNLPLLSWPTLPLPPMPNGGAHAS